MCRLRSLALLSILPLLLVAGACSDDDGGTDAATDTSTDDTGATSTEDAADPPTTTAATEPGGRGEDGPEGDGSEEPDADTDSDTDTDTDDPAAGLADRTWEMSSYITGTGPDALRSATFGAFVSVAFGSDGTLAFTTGCNSGTARYVLDGDAVTLTDLSVGGEVCFGSEGDVETAVLAVLGDAGQPFTATVRNDLLDLTSADGGYTLAFSGR